MSKEDGYDKFRVEIELTSHSSLNMCPERLLTYIDYRLKMVKASKYTSIGITFIDVKKVG